MHFNQIIYCSELNDAAKFLQQKLGGVVRSYKDFIEPQHFDNNIVLTDGIEKCTKHFRDIVVINKDQLIPVKSSEVDERFVFNLIENTQRKSDLGSASFNGDNQLPLKVGESFSFSFEYEKKTLEKITVHLDCDDLKQSVFLASVFDADSTKCLFNKNLRYISFSTKRYNLAQAPESFLEIPFDNPEFDAMGKKYAVTVKYVHASKDGAEARIWWNNDYSPHKLLYQDAELFGSVNFFAS